MRKIIAAAVLATALPSHALASSFIAPGEAGATGAISSIIHLGEPAPIAKAPTPDVDTTEVSATSPTVATFDPNAMPMVLRGGIEGDALPAPVEASAPQPGPADETPAATAEPEPAVAP